MYIQTYNVRNFFNLLAYKDTPNELKSTNQLKVKAQNAKQVFYYTYSLSNQMLFCQTAIKLLYETRCKGLSSWCNG